MNKQNKEKNTMLNGLIRRFEREDEFAIAEQKMLVTSVYTAAQKELVTYKTEERLPKFTKEDYPTLYIISKLGRNKTAGIRKALQTSTDLVEHLPDNYQKVLDGANFTTQHMSIKNLRILVNQWKASENYVVASHRFLHQLVIELKKTKPDYKIEIAPSEQEYMKEMRKKVLELSKQYKK